MKLPGTYTIKKNGHTHQTGLSYPDAVRVQQFLFELGDSTKKVTIKRED